MRFEKNIGVLDMVLRLGLSLGAIYLGFIDQEIIGDVPSSTVIGIIGVLNLVVALVRFCPLYVLAKVNTCKLD